MAPPHHMDIPQSPELIAKQGDIEGGPALQSIDARDVNTPDNWIPRNPDLIRLTGKHPFNCEPPLPTLMENGFITPSDLHYVRNHGAVPQLSWDAHRVQISGLVQNSVDITMEQLISLPSVTMPVTLVCAGNRRKEQNMIKQTIGGPSGVSTSIWTGVRLSVLLKLVAGGVLKQAKYVCFEGADKLPTGHYGTSIDIERAMNDINDVIVAYKMNGQLLTPDHGYPVRIIIPGVIGGRMVKWLAQIIVSEKESSNHYHYHDNRVLPSHVDAETAKKDGWWYKPEYIINELNINSTISSPSHDEVIPLSSPASLTANYTMKGYAYCGGGKKVTRVEISLDGGATWILTDLQHPEEHPQYSVQGDEYHRVRHWCWCFWSYTLPTHRIIQCKELMVRAWDQSHNTQPERLTWNVMGMMNNCVFRVKVQLFSPANGLALKFEHPTQPANAPGGWMVKSEEATVKTVEAPKFISGAKSMKSFTIEDVAKHDKEDDCWIIVDGRVYDCTKFLEDHPGGADSILINAGIDCTEEFNAIHSTKAQGMLTEYLIGSILQVTGLPTPTQTPPHTPTPTHSSLSKQLETPAFLHPKLWKAVTLVKKQSLSHDTRLFRFALDTPDQHFGLPVGKHIFLRANLPLLANKTTIRAYTPSSPPATKGHFDLVVKIYFAGVKPQFPEGGAFSQYLERLRVGDTVEVKGPLGSFVYEGAGRYSGNSGKRKGTVREIGMICGGTGITPLWQVVQEIFKEDGEGDDTRVSLLVGNRTEDDILLRKELDDIVAKFGADRIQVCRPINFRNVLSQKAPKGWQYGVGYINEHVIAEKLFPFKPSAADSERIVLICGPPPMVTNSCIPALKKLYGSEFADTRVFVF
ncbi:nitrate reductase [Jimgerdemannia flammicorona]|uniref:Nitrate reductase [NADPH] n=1 Tax=Jimgerdemannia flammicorona TaxID=994334 RepID=A0A433D9G4_9FUNG|nr:nitrate reductase [Jimgerdemannia flammicorona]